MTKKTQEVIKSLGIAMLLAVIVIVALKALNIVD